MIELAKIETSLSQGKFLSKNNIAFFYFAMSVTLILPLLTIIMLIVHVEWDSQIFFVMLLGNIMFLSLLAVLIFILIKNIKLKKKIILWLDDAIETTARVKNIGQNRLGFQPKAIKISIKFYIDNKAHTRESTAKVFGGQEGYLGIFKKYADREIKILYSIKHDEVLILKDN